LVAAALLCFAAAAVLSPSDVRSQLDVRRRDTVVEQTPRLELPLAPIAPAGDAFAPRAGVDDDAPPTTPAPPPLRLPQLPQIGLRLPSAAPVTHMRVTAIATGSQPTAIVENGGTARVVTIGDALDGSTIAAIQDDAIRLVNGRSLSLEPAAHTP
jgi:hypothetical protein